MALALSATAFGNGGGVTIAQPADGSIVSGAVPVALTMAPQVAVSNLYIDGVLYASGADANLTWDSSTVADGTHVVAVKSFSAYGRFLRGQAVMVAVQNSTATVSTPTPSAIPAPTPTALSTPVPTDRKSVV